MNLLEKAKGLTKKIRTIIDNPEEISALISGVYHYNNPNDIIEELKNERADICDSCDSIKYDDFEKIKDSDDRISGKMCGVCYCSLPYLLRQTKKRCELNKW